MFLKIIAIIEKSYEMLKYLAKNDSFPIDEMKSKLDSIVCHMVFSQEAINCLSMILRRINIDESEAHVKEEKDSSKKIWTQIFHHHNIFHMSHTLLHDVIYHYLDLH